MNDLLVRVLYAWLVKHIQWRTVWKFTEWHKPQLRNRISGWNNTAARATTSRKSIQCRKHQDSFQLNFCWKMLFYATNSSHSHSLCSILSISSIKLVFSVNVGHFLPLVPGTPPFPFCPFIPGPPVCPFLPAFPQWPFIPAATNTTLLQFTLSLLVPEACVLWISQDSPGSWNTPTSLLCSPNFIPLFLIKLVWLTRPGLQAPEVADLLQLCPHSPLGPWFPGEPGNPFSPQGPGSPGEPLSPGNNSNCLVAFSPFVPARGNIQCYIQYMCHHAGVCFCVLPFCPGQPWGPGTPHPPGGPLFPFIPQNTNEEQLY